MNIPGGTRSRYLIGVLAAATLVLTACGGGESADPTSAALATGLEPQPLAEPTTLTATIGARTDVAAALLLADKLGEFAKENISIDLGFMLSAEAFPALAQGQTDVALAGVAVPFFNAVAGGADIRMAFPGPTSNPADGLFVPIDPATGEPGEVTKIATLSGPGNMYMVPIGRYLESVGKTIHDVTFEKVDLADMEIALENGAVDAAWVNAPATAAFASNDKYKRVIGYEDGEYGVAYYLGPNLLSERPEVAQAVIRALARTVRDHLSGDYKADDAKVAALAEVLEATPEVVRQIPSMTFTADLPVEGIQKAQSDWLAIGDLLEYDAPLDPSAYSDTAFLDRALESGG